ncbi:MAG: menaquinol oxidoreductase [Desulfuromonadales bacterium]|nr:menaquinol oxidoreductase [Desulfuromonadales bacterium]
MGRSQSFPAGQEPDSREKLQAEIEARIRKLERSTIAGLVGIILFLLVSFGAYSQFSMLPDLSEEAWVLLGAPPPVEMISLALVVYAFSGIILILGRMTNDKGRYRGLMHAGFLTGFYTFYHLSGGLPDNFWATFFAGMSVLGLENYLLWMRTNSAILRERAELERLLRKAEWQETSSEN